MIYKKLIALLIPVLSIWCLFNLYGIWKITNWFELLIPFIVYMLPFDLILLGVSFYVKRQGQGWEKNLAVLGLFVAAISITVPMLVLFHNYLDYYFASKNYFKYVNPEVWEEFHKKDN